MPGPAGQERPRYVERPYACDLTTGRRRARRQDHDVRVAERQPVQVPAEDEPGMAARWIRGEQKMAESRPLDVGNAVSREVDDLAQRRSPPKLGRRGDASGQKFGPRIRGGDLRRLRIG